MLFVSCNIDSDDRIVRVTVNGRPEDIQEIAKLQGCPGRFGAETRTVATYRVDDGPNIAVMDDFLDYRLETTLLRERCVPLTKYGMTNDYPYLCTRLLQRDIIGECIFNIPAILREWQDINYYKNRLPEIFYFLFRAWKGGVDPADVIKDMDNQDFIKVVERGIQPCPSWKGFRVRVEETFIDLEKGIKTFVNPYQVIKGLPALPEPFRPIVDVYRAAMPCIHRDNRGKYHYGNSEIYVPPFIPKKYRKKVEKYISVMEKALQGVLFPC